MQFLTKSQPLRIVRKSPYSHVQYCRWFDEVLSAVPAVLVIRGVPRTNLVPTRAPELRSAGSTGSGPRLHDDNVSRRGSPAPARVSQQSPSSANSREASRRTSINHPTILQPPTLAHGTWDPAPRCASHCHCYYLASSYTFSAHNIATWY